MGIDVGSNSIAEIYYGNNAISEVYYGNDLVWSASVPEVNYIFRDIDSNGNLTLATGNLEDASNLKKIDTNGLEYGFYNCSGLTGTVSFPNLTTVKAAGLSYAFNGCSQITSVSFPKLIEIETNGLYATFGLCTSLTGSINFSSLTTIRDNGLGGTFSRCTGLTSISFPALKVGKCSNTSFNSGMLYGITGCAVHFPSNFQSVMSSWNNVTAGFGGTNTTVLFDLPSTE